MLDPTVTDQLRTHLEKVTRPIELVASLDGSDRSAQMAELLDEIAALSDHVTVVHPDDAPEPDDIDLVVVDSNQARAQTVLDAAKARDFSTRYYSEPDTAVRELTGERPTTMARVLLLPDQSVLERLGSLRRITKVVVVAEQEQALIDAFDQGAFDCIASSASLPVLMKRIERAVEA